MNKAAAISLLLGVAIWGAVMAVAFNQSLPNWCANPSGPGNHLVQPLCK